MGNCSETCRKNCPLKGLAPVFGVDPLAPVFGVDPLKKQKVRLAIGLADFLNFFGSLYGAEGGTRQW